MSNSTDVSRFLQAVFPDFGTRAIFSYSIAGGGMQHVRDVARLDASRDCYLSIAAFPDDGVTKRTTARASEVRLLVVDDVGQKVPEGSVLLALGPATAVVETSAGNFQWTYRLSPGVAVGEWDRFFAAVEGLVGARLDQQDAVHVNRMPMGRNTKKGRGGFAVNLISIDETVEIDPRKIALGPAAAGPSGPARAQPRVRDIRALLGLIPNDLGVDRAAWVARAHQVKALALDEEEGREAFHLWSRGWPGGYDEAETERVWNSLDVSRTSGLVLLEDAEAADAAGFERVMGREARDVFDDEVTVAPPGKPGKPGGKVEFDLGSNKEILKTMENAARGLTGLGITCAYDQFHHRVTIHGGGRRAKMYEGRLTDHAVLMLRVELSGAYGKDFGPVHVGDAVMALALLNAFNPVTDMLAEAELFWDGVPRLDRLGPDYFHTEDTELARACFRKVMIAAVRRARVPGCKFDQILVTESPEGWNKSTAWAVLAGEGNFSDESILGKDARAVQEALADIWIHESADLSGLTRAEVEHVKAFASRTNDRARPAYGRFLIDQPRQSIEVGTTNADTYLLSQTGNRRFWPFRLGKRVELEMLRRDRMALWGEAAACESAGESLVLAETLWGLAGAAQEERRVVDPWEDELGRLIEMPPGMPFPTGCERISVRDGEQFICNSDIHEYLGGYRRQPLTSGAGRKIAEIMKRLGWRRVVVVIGGVAARGYKRTRPSISSVSVISSVAEKLF